MKKFKQLLEEKIILSAVMCVLLAVVLITATYAWYVLYVTPKAYGLKLSTGGGGGLKVAVEPGGPDIMSDEYYNRYYSRFGKITQFYEEENGNRNLIATIPINLKDFENIEGGKIAPGAYGKLPFYITSMSSNIRSYEIKVQFEYKPNKNVTADMDEEEKAEWEEYVENMITDHFTIYQKMEGEGEDVRFHDPLTFYEKGSNRVISAKGNLPLNEEVKHELYWVWNYELTDIDSYWKLERFKEEYGDDLAVDKNGKPINEIVTRYAIRQYDEEDTELGNYLEDIWFNVYIVGSPGRIN